VLDQAEVRRWLGLLGSGPVHHSMDAAAENVLAKLGEYGLRAGLPALDERALPYCDMAPGGRYHADALILAPFLARLGYAGQPGLAEWIAGRIQVLYAQVCSGEEEIYMDAAGLAGLPLAQRGKRFYRPELGSDWGVLRLPTCYDLYLLAHLPPGDPVTRQKAEAILGWLLRPEFQETPGGYIWNQALRRPYAAGRVFIACLPRAEERAKLLLFMELLARFACGRSSAWFQEGLAHLESFRTPSGTYRFPPAYLSEKSGYYLYAGLHMGLGEAPRGARALELESTFRMLYLKKLAGLD
jgi:hypothetical protein